MAQFFWKSESCSDELNSALRIVSGFYGDRIAENSGGQELEFRKAESNVVKITRNGSVCRIEAGSLSGWLRGVSHAFAGVDADESAPFETLGIMLDCSRNKVFSLSYLKEMLVRLSLMGYNMAMLYTEDTYALPGEPFFGYMRGAFTVEELKEADAFAGQLGIELIGCIQTLGHLEQILAYGEYGKVRDTASVLMVDEPETYKLIEKMILFWKEALSSRRLHIGMDETHDLGRGRFLDHNGYESAFELFNRHLGRVNRLCQENGFRPVIWSDMYFRLGNKTQTYYDLHTNIPQEVRARIPRNVQLCYWDYYNTDTDFYEKFIGLHRDLGFEPVMGAGVWTWSRFWYDHVQTARTVVPCIQACRRTGLKELFFTMWGDNGGYCAYDSSFAGLEFASGLAFGHDAEDTAFFTARFRAVCGEDFGLFTELGKIAVPGIRGVPEIRTEYLLWDDPLLGINHLSYRTSGQLDAYRKSLAGLLEKLGTAELSPALRVVRSLIRFLVPRMEFQVALLDAYRESDAAAFRMLADVEIPKLTALLDEFCEEFRADWLRCAKPFGLEVIQERNAGVRARLLELRRRLLESSPIPELDAQLRALDAGCRTPIRCYSGSIHR